MSLDPRFPLLGEPLALDLLNTRVGSSRADLIADVDGLARWLGHQAGRLPPVPADERLLGALHVLRDDIARLVEVRLLERAVDRRAMTAVNAAAGRASAERSLVWDDDRLAAKTRWRGPTRDRVLAAIASSAIELLGDASRTVAACEGPGCVLVFDRQHPRRRWCSSSTCGNRTRVARHYRRASGSDDGGGPNEPTHHEEGPCPQ